MRFGFTQATLLQLQTASCKIIYEMGEWENQYHSFSWVSLSVISALVLGLFPGCSGCGQDQLEGDSQSEDAWPDPDVSDLVEAPEDPGHDDPGTDAPPWDAEPEDPVEDMDALVDPEPLDCMAFTPQYWIKTYGGDELEFASSIQEVTGGGFLISGWTGSYDPSSDLTWILKLNADGQILWEKMGGSESGSGANALQETDDGGLIVTGWLVRSGEYGDMYLMKLDGNGNVLWRKTYGGDMNDGGNAVQQTWDGGFIVGAETQSFGVTPGFHWWVFRLDGAGDIQWQRMFAESQSGSVTGLVETPDHGFILAGFLYTNGRDADFCVVKLDQDGSIVWQKSFGGGLGNDDSISGMDLTDDGGLILAGSASSFVEDPSRAPDAFIFRLNGDGDLVWAKNVGRHYNDNATAVVQAGDGGFVWTGLSQSLDPYLWIVRMSGSGSMEWEKTYLVDFGSMGSALKALPDGDLIVAGSGEDLVVLKLDSEGLVSSDCPADVEEDTPLLVTDAPLVPRDLDYSMSDTSATVREASTEFVDTAATVRTLCCR